jgi:hypothetical protein
MGGLEFQSETLAGLSRNALAFSAMALNFVAIARHFNVL